MINVFLTLDECVLLQWPLTFDLTHSVSHCKCQVGFCGSATEKQMKPMKSVILDMLFNKKTKFQNWIWINEKFLLFKT